MIFHRTRYAGNPSAPPLSAWDCPLLWPSHLPSTPLQELKPFTPLHGSGITPHEWRVTGVDAGTTVYSTLKVRRASLLLRTVREHACDMRPPACAMRVICVPLPSLDRAALTDPFASCVNRNRVL